MDKPKNNGWIDMQKKYKNSIVQITTHSGSFNLGEPYRPPEVRKSRGSGFLITKEGHFLTNAHVVEGAITVTFRSEVAGNTDLDVDIIGICPHKDIALLKVSPKDLSKIQPFAPMEFGDDNKLIHTEQLVAIGFPLGRERIKFTVGAFSGLETPETDDGSINQSYIQTDVAINPGNSGGPLVNQEGKVVGINAAGFLLMQNISFAIPSRVVLSILRDLFLREGKEDKIVPPPRLGVVLHKITDDHFLAAGITKEADQLGKRVKEVIPGTPLKGIKEGDIIQWIEYSDPYTNKSSFDTDMYRNGVCINCSNEPDTIIEISKYGNIKLIKKNNGQEIESQFSQDRKVTLLEVLDTIPSNTSLNFAILRNGVLRSLNDIPFKNEKVQAIGRVFPPFSTLDYVIFAGIVWIPLSTNIINMIGESKHICEFLPFRNRNEPRVMLAQIFPRTDAEQTEALERTEIIESVNEIKVNTLDQLRNIITESTRRKSYIIIKMKSGSEFIINPMRANAQDKFVHNAFSIKPNNFTRKLWDM